MASLSDVFKDPQRLQQLSQFLLNFGSGVAQADARGFGPLASIAVGFGTGGQGIQQARLQQQREADREADRAFREQNLALRRQGVESQERARRDRQRAAADEQLSLAQFVRFIGGQPSFDAGVAPVAGGPARGQQTSAFVPGANLADPVQRQRAAGLAADAGLSGVVGRLIAPPPSEPVVEFFDPDSPTGTRFGTRGEAVGQPGKPPRGFEITTPDGTTIRTGVRTAPGEREAAKVQTRLNERKTATLNALQGISRITDQIREGGATIQSVAGGFARLVNSAGAQMKALASQSGIRLSPERFNFNAFPETAPQSAAFRSNILDLAFSVARSRQGTGQLSDREVQQALDTIGASAGSPEQLFGALQETAERSIFGVDTAFQVQLGRPSGIRDDIQSLGINLDFSLPQAGAAGGNVDRLTAEQLRGLSDAELQQLLQQRGLIGGQ